MSKIIKADSHCGAEGKRAENPFKLQASLLTHTLHALSLFLPLIHTLTHINLHYHPSSPNLLRNCTLGNKIDERLNKTAKVVVVSACTSFLSQKQASNLIRGDSFKRAQTAHISAARPQSLSLKWSISTLLCLCICCYSITRTFALCKWFD